MLKHVKIILSATSMLLLVACGGGSAQTTQSTEHTHADILTKDAMGDNLPVSNEIDTVTEDASIFVEKSSYLNQDYISVIPKAMDTLQVQITKSTPATISPAAYIRANDIAFVHEGKEIFLYNRSYKKIKSLIGKYNDENDHTRLVKIEFDTIIQPFSVVTLAHFTNAEVMKVYHTEALFDQSIRYDGMACDSNNDETEIVKYCMPTQAEQKQYGQLMATLHTFYNSTDALPAWMAWTQKKSYKNLHFSHYDAHYQIPQIEESVKEFMKATMPNNLMTLKSSSYMHQDNGVASGENISLMGTKENHGWASLWYEHLLPHDHSEITTANTYSLLHHEMMHGRGFSHCSGMTYGFSSVVGKLIETSYDDNYPVTEAPKYVFDVTFQEQNKMLLSVYTTSASQAHDLRLEILSAHPIEPTYSSGIHQHQGIVTIDKTPSIRFFLRLYDADSTQVMSQLIYPSQFIQSSKQFNNQSKSYHIIPHNNWKEISEHNDESIQMLPKHAEAICKAWTGSYQAKTEEIRKVELFENIEKSLLVHSPYSYKEYYSHCNNESKLIAYDTIINDNTTSILCKVE